MKPHVDKTNRIVLFNATLQAGGAERVISILAQHLLEGGYHVEVLLYHNKPIFYSMPAGLKITSVAQQTGSTNILKNIYWMRHFFKHRADVVISFLAPFNMLALAAHMGLRSKILVADRNDPRYIPTNCLMRCLRNLLYRFADGIVLQTNHNKNYFSAHVQAKSTVIYNPVELGNKRGLALRTPKQDKIVSVGRLMPQKNQALLLHAFSRIQAQFPTYTLVVYGVGPEKTSLQGLARQLGLEKRVIFAGNIHQIFEAIADAKLFVLSSNYEGMPNALIEAMCLGLPVITTDVSGAKELIENGKSGFIVPKNSPDKLAQAMCCVLADAPLQKQLAAQAVKLNDKLAVATIANQWMEFIEKRGESK